MNAQAAQNAPVAASVFAEIAAAEKSIGAFKGVAAEQSKAANEAKVGAYAVLVISLRATKLVKGNLPRAVSNAVKKGLLENAGVKEAVAKKYLENSVGLLRKLDWSAIPTQATADVLKDQMLQWELTSESKIAKFVTGEVEKDEMRLLAEKLVGKFTTRKNDAGERVQGVFKPSDFNEDDWNHFDDMVRTLKAARKEAQEAAAAAEARMSKENAEIDRVLDGMDGHETDADETVPAEA